MCVYVKGENERFKMQKKILTKIVLTKNRVKRVVS